VTALVAIAQEAQLFGDLKLAADCYKSLLPYVAPKLGSIEVESAGAPEIRVVEIATGIPGAPGSAVRDQAPAPGADSRGLDAAYEELGL
jgi:hypothetical protein